MGDHMSFVCDNIVSQQMAFAIFSIYLKILLIYIYIYIIYHVPGITKQIPIPVV